MKKIKNKFILFVGSVACTCLMATVAFGNPAMLPDHPGHPMKPLKSPVTGQSLANDPGRESGTGQKALNAATRKGNQEQKLRSRASLNKESVEEFQNDQNEMSGQNQRSGQEQMGSQNK